MTRRASYTRPASADCKSASAGHRLFNLQRPRGLLEPCAGGREGEGAADGRFSVGVGGGGGGGWAGGGGGGAGGGAGGGGAGQARGGGRWGAGGGAGARGGGG